MRRAQKEAEQQRRRRQEEGDVQESQQPQLQQEGLYVVHRDAVEDARTVGQHLPPRGVTRAMLACLHEYMEAAARK